MIVQHAGRVGEDVLELGDELDDREVLVLDLLALEGGEAGEPHVEDGLGLQLGQVEARHQVVARDVDVGRLADRLDDRVEVVEGDLEALEDVRPGARLAEVELGPPPDDLLAVVDVVLEHAAQRQRLRLPVDQRQHVHVERELHRGVLEQVVQHLVRVGVALDLDVDAHPVAVRLVAQVGDAVDPLVLDEVGDLLEQGRLVHLVRQLGDDDRDPVAADLLERDLGAHHDPAAAVGVHLADRVDRLPLAGQDVALLLEAEDRAAGREVRAEHELAQVVGRELGVVDEGDRGVDDLAEVVRRDVGGHADGDARRAVDEQVRELGRQDRRLLLGAVVVVDEVDRLLVDVGEHLGRDRGQARLGVAHRRRVVAVDRAEVALPVDQRVAHREVLGEADEGVVEGDVAVRVVLAHHLADDRGALAEGAGRRQAHLAHRVQDPAVDRLEAVADVRQRARDDDAHRVVEVRDAHLVLDADGSDVAQVVGHGRLLLIRSAAVRDGCAGRADRRSDRPGSAAAEVDGAPGRRRMPARRSRSSVGVGRVELGEAVADDPCAVAVVGRDGAIGLGAQGRGRALRDRRWASERYAHDSAFWTSGSASPMSWPRSGRAWSTTSGPRPVRRLPWVIVAIVDADEAALPARRREDELLELRPAVRLGDDAGAVRVGEVVDGDPVGRLPGAAPEQLPGPLGVARPASARGARRRTSAPRGGPRGTGDRRGTAAGSADRGGSRLRKPRTTAASSGQRTPMDRAEARGDELLAGEVLGSASAAQARRAGPLANASGSWTWSARRVPSASAAGLRSATNATARAVAGLRGRARPRRRWLITRPSTVAGRIGAPGAASSRSAARSCALARLVGGARTRRSRSPASLPDRRVEQMRPAVSTSRRRERVTQPSARSALADRDRALELDAQARRQAPVVLARPAPRP